MPNPVQIKDFPHIHSGATPASQTKLTDLLVIEHMDAPSSTDKTLKMMIGQLLCKPVFTVASQQSGNGRYSATCQNYAGFSLFYTDSQNARHYFIGLPIKIIFTPACNYGSVSGNTYPTISFNGSDFIPILANGKTVASGAWQAGQSLEGCIIQTILNGATVYAFDLNSNIRQQDSNSTIYSDGTIVYSSSSTDIRYPIVVRVSHSNPFDIKNRLLDNISSLPIGVSILEMRGGTGFENIRTVIFVNKNYDNRFSYIASRTIDTEPSFTHGAYMYGVWFDT